MIKTKKLTKIIILMLMIISLFSTLFISSSAETVKSKLSLKRLAVMESDTPYPNPYPNKVPDNIPLFKETYKGKEYNIPMYSDVNTGITGYCIEHDTPATGRIEMTVYDWEKSPYWKKFSEKQRFLFRIALLYGYPNFNNSDLPDCDEYVATQCMIWEIEKGRNFRDDLLRSNSSKIAYQRLKDRMNEHSRKPSFDNKTVELKWDKNTKTYKGKITDTNNELKNFSISKVNGVTMKKNGNALEIESTRIIETPLRVNANKTTVPKAKSSKGMFLLEADDNQNCIFGNADDPVRSTFNIQTESVNMIKKISVNTGKFLSGATLELIRVSNGERKNLFFN